MTVSVIPHTPSFFEGFAKRFTDQKMQDLSFQNALKGFRDYFYPGQQTQGQQPGSEEPVQPPQASTRLPAPTSGSGLNWNPQYGAGMGAPQGMGGGQRDPMMGILSALGRGMGGMGRGVSNIGQGLGAMLGINRPQAGGYGAPGMMRNLAGLGGGQPGMPGGQGAMAGAMGPMAGMAGITGMNPMAGTAGMAAMNPMLMMLLQRVLGGQRRQQW